MHISLYETREKGNLINGLYFVFFRYEHAYRDYPPFHHLSDVYI